MKIIYVHNADSIRIDTAETPESGAAIFSEDIGNTIDQEERQTVRRFLETMRDGVNDACDRCGDCNKCSCDWPSVLCDFRNLWDVGIDTIMSKYEDFKRQENGE